jgi:hypothetical protein
VGARCTVMLPNCSAVLRRQVSGGVLASRKYAGPAPTTVAAPSDSSKTAALSYSDGADAGDPAILQNARHKNQQAAQAITFYEMRVGDGAGQERNFQEVAREGHLIAIRIGESSRRMDGVDDGGERKFSENGETGAGTAYGLARGD